VPGAIAFADGSSQRLAMRISASNATKVTAFAQALAGNEKAHFRWWCVGIRCGGECLTSECHGAECQCCCDDGFSGFHGVTPSGWMDFYGR
jgi:hypothetical protein